MVPQKNVKNMATNNKKRNSGASLQDETVHVLDVADSPPPDIPLMQLQL